MVLIEKIKEEIIVDIKENDGENNLEDIKLSFLKNGTTIIVGENNAGKTNLLNYIYEKNERVFSEKYNKDVWRLVGKDADEKYYYKLYYFDLATAIGPLTKDKLKVRVERLKECFCQIRNFTRGRSSLGIDEYDGYNPGMKKHHEIKKTGSGQSKYETLEDLIKKLILEKSESRKQKPKEFYNSILLIDEPEVLLNPFRVKKMASLIKDVVKKRELTVILATHSPEFLSHFIYEKSAKLVVAQKNYKSGKLKPPLCF
ncbi:6469_t:CDS:2 [Funneliformis geosporum]|nr:6469_t:CDS:2 [Funneliformis geosporum]